MYTRTLTLLAALAFCAPALAVPMTFVNDPVADRALFEAAAGPLVVESFEDTFTNAASVGFPVGGPQAFTVSTNNGNLSSSTFARGVSDGTRSLAVDEEPQTTLTFSFASAINAFGIDINDMNFVNLSISDNLGNNFSDILLGDNGGPAGGPSFENRQFFGLVNSDAFSTVTLTFTQASASGTLFVDRLQYGGARIPEPATLALMGLGFVGLGYTRKRRAV